MKSKTFMKMKLRRTAGRLTTRVAAANGKTPDYSRINIKRLMANRSLTAWRQVCKN
jgi:hypothetical protein